MASKSKIAKATAEAQVFHAAQPPLPELRPAAGGVSQVRHVPNLLPQDGRPGLDSGRAEGELVRGSSHEFNP